VTQPILTFAEFQAKLAAALEVPVEQLSSETDFLSDLAFDSMRMLELGLMFENLDVPMPAELAWEVQTVGVAYDYYTRTSSGDVDVDG
jgi:acyl carrier protein